MNDKKEAQGQEKKGERISLLKVLGPTHVWALGVGIVLVGEYMGYNFSVGKGGRSVRSLPAGLSDFCIPASP